jgi:hypothetical protein
MKALADAYSCTRAMKTIKQKKEELPTLEIKVHDIILFIVSLKKGAGGSVMVKARCYKPEGRTFETQ